MLRTFAFVTLAVASACGGSKPVTQPSETPPPAGTKTATTAHVPTEAEQREELKKMFERESTGLQEVAFAVGDGLLSGKVEASGAPKVEAGEGFWRMSVPIGASLPVTCFVYPKAIDLATVLATSIDNIKKSVDVKGVQVMPADIVGRTPVFRVAAFYVAEQNGTKKLGAIKEVAATSGDTGLFCLHDEPGYEKTFLQTTSGLVKAVDAVAARSNPAGLREVEVGLMKINGIAAGYTSSSRTRFADGRETGVEVSSMLAPRSQTDLIGTDSSHITEADKDGKVAHQRHIDVQNGETATDLDLTRDKAKTYTYSGLFQAKEVKGTITAKDDLVASFIHADRFRKQWAKSGKAEVTYDSYSPSGKLEALTTITLKSDPKDKSRYEMQQGELAITGDLDEKGRMRNGKIEMGRMALEIERKFWWEAP